MRRGGVGGGVSEDVGGWGRDGGRGFGLGGFFGDGGFDRRCVSRRYRGGVVHVCIRIVEVGEWCGLLRGIDVHRRLVHDCCFV